MFSFLSHDESARVFPPFSRVFSAFFPGISAQKNRHIFTQSRVRSAQKARNPKLTTIIKKWPFPAPSQEIRPKGRNLGNGHLFCILSKIQEIYIYIYGAALATPPPPPTNGYGWTVSSGSSGPPPCGLWWWYGSSGPPPLWPVVVVWFFWSPPPCGLWWWYVGMLV